MNTLTMSGHAHLRAQFDALKAAAHPLFTPLLTVTDLTEEAILQIIHGRTLAVKVRNLIAEHDALQIAARLLEGSTWSHYQTAGAQGIAINGQAIFECEGDRNCPTYFATAVRTRRAVRKLLAPLASPIDVMQAELDTAWSPGAKVLTLNGRKCHVGLQRCFSKGGEALHHNDRARVDFDHPKTAGIKFQFALNAYLGMGDGGELELWNLLPSDALYDEARHPFGPTYAVRGELLPPPDLVVRPEPGDFIMFNAEKIHRVRPVLGNGARVTVSAFAAYFSTNEPLEIFS